MADREKIAEELRQEIGEMEQEIAEKKLLRVPVMTLGTGKCTESFGPAELVREIEELERELERQKNLLAFFEDKNLGGEPIPKVDKNDLLLPEYREGGYFTSQDFYDKCEEFHKMLEEEGESFLSLPRSEYIFRKKKFLQEKYGITWLSEEHQFLPGVVVDVHISHPKNF